MQRKRVAALVLVRTRELEVFARTSCFVAEVVRRRLVSSSPRFNLQKEVSARVNGDLARRARETGLNAGFSRVPREETIVIRFASPAQRTHVG